MGRHTKIVEDGVPDDEGSRRRRRVGKVPLLPAVSGVVAIGAVVSAVSTQQISLNFAGGPPTAQKAQPQVSESAQPNGRHSRRTARDDSSLTPREGSRVSRGTSRTAITVALRTVSTWRAGYLGQATITNRGARSVNGWTLTLRYPQTKIISAWDVKIIRKGDTLVAGNPADRPTIAPGKSVKVSFTAKGAVARPTICSFNGKAC
ncbi:cellulose binding domain-containing protein [Actinomadura sp. DC4]|uniref:cellulose binding domain-containing protein n=1 Tax=Actinomadura sp. DC4 TaxID=3055069 RepID=UPI0025B15455|nr:cellulose binding domain-containing protein [Actinomadura sp. DC4]MDN3356644.1 cellulose binding domain-containing protein [Actinomadura sp. DC4]